MTFCRGRGATFSKHFTEFYPGCCCPMANPMRVPVCTRPHAHATTLSGASGVGYHDIRDGRDSADRVARPRDSGLHQLPVVGETQLVADVAAVRVDGVDAHAQRLGDFLRRQSLAQVEKNFALAQ